MARSTVAGLSSSIASKTSKSGKTSIEWDFAQDKYGHGVGLYTNLKSFSSKARKNLRAYMEIWANEITMYMKQNHKWRNRSGAAERGIAAHVTGQGSNQYGSKIMMELRHGEIVWYGWRLEYLYGRKYAIIEPTLNEFSRKVMDGISLERLYFGNIGW